MYLSYEPVFHLDLSPLNLCFNLSHVNLCNLSHLNLCGNFSPVNLCFNLSPKNLCGIYVM